MRICSHPGCCIFRAYITRFFSSIKVPKITMRDMSLVSLYFQMRTMSDETEQQVCDEDFGSEEEGDVESYLEDNSSDLMDRLRELEVSITVLLRVKHETGSGMKVFPAVSGRKLCSSVGQ